jgi:hypothetical protein
MQNGIDLSNNQFSSTEQDKPTAKVCQILDQKLFLKDSCLYSFRGESENKRKDMNLSEITFGPISDKPLHSVYLAPLKKIDYYSNQFHSALN